MSMPANPHCVLFLSTPNVCVCVYLICNLYNSVRTTSA